MRKLTPIMDFWPNCLLKKLFKITIKFFCHNFFFTFCPNFDIQRHFGPKMASFSWFVHNMDSRWENWPLEWIFWPNCLLKKLFKITIKFFWHNFFFILCPNFDIYRHFGPKMTSFWWFVHNMDNRLENLPLQRLNWSKC